MNRVFFACLAILVSYAFASMAFGVSTDLAIDSDSVTFSDNSPTEGDPITISVTLHNMGTTDLTDDLEVRFVEGDPEKGGLQIGTDAIVLGLKAGATSKAEIKWRAAPGNQANHLPYHAGSAFQRGPTQPG